MSILFEQTGHVLVASLNKPETLNALSSDVVGELVNNLKVYIEDTDVGCVVITGSESVFCAGADIREMKNKSFVDIYRADYFSEWEQFSALKIPKIAAVSGYALGGGCELAMMCDLIFASDTAKFAQPEIRLGVIPGMGGTQRLTRLIGKSKAMDMILTGKVMDANEAYQAGLASRVFSVDSLMHETLKIAESIASFGSVSVNAARECTDSALELGLKEGIGYERRIFHSLFATLDQKEGMAAFLEKRPAEFSNN